MKKTVIFIISLVVIVTLITLSFRYFDRLDKNGLKEVKKEGSLVNNIIQNSSNNELQLIIGTSSNYLNNNTTNSIEETLKNNVQSTTMSVQAACNKLKYFLLK